MGQLVAIKHHAGIDAEALAAALTIQGAELAAAWSIEAPRVVAYTTRKPRGAWRIQFYDTFPPGMGGVHLNTKTGVPYAKVLTSEGSVAASHEFCEMLVDPLGERFQTTSVNRDYLVEVCDPCEAITYLINNIEVSDFILPAWYSSSEAKIGDHLGRLVPYHLAPGGYVSWIQHGEWFQAFMDDQGHTSTRDLGPATAATRAEKDQLSGRDDHE